MSSWIVSYLGEAATTLESIGKGELAAFLDRLRHEPEVQDLKLYKSLNVARLADSLHECDGLDELFVLIKETAEAFGVSHCTVHCIRERPTAFFHTKVLTTFPQQWVAEYVDRRYTVIDPLLARCRSQTGTFFWDEVAVSDPFTRHFIKAGLQAGIGPGGVCLVQQASNGSTIGVTLCSTMDHETFRRVLEPQLSDLEEIAAILVTVFSELACENNQARFNPTDDQLKVLRALASGRSVAEVERFHFLYGSFKTIEKSILKCFGARTLAQATALAANMGLLEDLPYFKEDVFAGHLEHHTPDAVTLVC
jgi:hypothetical protein